MPATSAADGGAFDTFEHALVRLRHGHERARAGAARRRCRAQGARRRQRHARARGSCRAPSIIGHPTSTASSMLPPAPRAPARGDKVLLGPGPLRPHGQSARLVRGRARARRRRRRGLKACGRWRPAGRCSNFVAGRRLPRGAGARCIVEAGVAIRYVASNVVIEEGSHDARGTPGLSPACSIACAATARPTRTGRPRR